MSREATTPGTFGHRVLGPIVAEFCLRLWSLGSLMEQQDDVGFLFCARGGLRMQLVYERFLTATALSSPVRIAPLMVSRLVAMRAALMRTVEESSDDLLPAAATTLSYEFPGASISEVARAITGVEPDGTAGSWDVPLTSRGLAALLGDSEGEVIVESLTRQAGLFERHLRGALGERYHAVLVDTGLYGTTRHLLAEGFPSIDFSSALIARSYRPGYGPGPAKTFGLSVEADGYSALRRRTAILRYWHFIEWLFEPELPSVRTFDEQAGAVRSNLEIDNWRDRIPPTPGSAFEGLMRYVDDLGEAPGQQIVIDSDRAWDEFRRAVVWPDTDHGHALLVGTRSHDFGKDGTWSARSWAGPVAALRGSTMWREGEIARSGTPLRIPLLAAIETAYALRGLKRRITRR